MDLFVSVPNAAAQFTAGAIFAAAAVLMPWAARWTVLAVALGAVGLAGIVAAFGSVDDLLVHSRNALELLPLMGPAMIGMIFGKNIVGLLIGR